MRIDGERERVSDEREREKERERERVHIIMWNTWRELDDRVSADTTIMTTKRLMVNTGFCCDTTARPNSLISTFYSIWQTASHSRSVK